MRPLRTQVATRLGPFPPSPSPKRRNNRQTRASLAERCQGGEGTLSLPPILRCAVGWGWLDGGAVDQRRRMDALLIPRTAAITLGRLRCCARGNKGGGGAPPPPLRFASVCVCSIPTTLVRGTYVYMRIINCIGPPSLSSSSPLGPAPPSRRPLRRGVVLCRWKEQRKRSSKVFLSGRNRRGGGGKK